MQAERRAHSLNPGAIIVMGVSGSDKSTLARLLAETLGCAFIEGDDLHCPSSVAKMRAGTPLCDEDRWPWLDRLANTLNEETAAHGMAVAACSALKFRYRDRIASAITVPTSFIMLETDRAELLRRMENRPGHYMPASLLDSQLAALERPHGTERALILEANISPAELCAASYDWLARDGA